MDQETYNFIVQIAALLLSAIGGVGIVPLVNWIKTQTNASGTWALVITAVVAVVTSLLILVSQQVLTPENTTAENWQWVLMTVLYASQIAFRRLRQQEIEANL